MRYSPFDALNIKFGHIVPTFNAFNEIKTKFPLQPYIYRPLVYETSFQYIIKPEEYLPSHAALQINGTFKNGPIKFDYAVFGGNSDFIVSNKIPGAGQFSIAGLDSTHFKLYGGRIGARFNGVKLGVSYTYDKTPNTTINSNIDLVNTKLKAVNTVSSFQIPLVNKVGEGDRNRIGIDFSAEAFGFTFESEYITLESQKSANGKKLVLFDLKTELNEKFYIAIGKTSTELKKNWMKKQLSGDGKAPVPLDSEDEMLSKVSSTPEAVGYVTKQKVTDAVKVLFELK